MTVDAADGLERVIHACQAIGRYIALPDLPEDVAHDAVRIRLVEIGDAVRTLPSRVTAQEPGIPWSHVAELGQLVTGRPDGATPTLVLGTARVDVPRLMAAAERLRARL